MTTHVRELVNYLLTLDQDKEIRFIEPTQGDWNEVGYCHVVDETTHYVLLGDGENGW